MAVFDNLKNFIRQGKQAATQGKSQSKSASGSKAKTGHLDASVGTANASTKSNSSATPEPNTSRNNNYDLAVKQIIAEENASRERVPAYPGLERYRLESKMGDGAFSVVYRAVDLQENEPRAIKIVAKKKLTQSQKSSVLKEAAIMRQLNHRNIVNLHQFIETPEHYFIVLELVPGGELFHQIVRLTYFSEDLSRHVIVQVAEAIRYLHEEAGVVHRDIKPENLLYSPIDFIPSKQRVLRPGDDDTKEDEGDFQPGIGGGGIGTIKLADFGLSKVIWDSKTMTPCGTVGYTAPEIVKDERYSKSVDMWALGCVLYTVLCGFPPFYDESIEVLTHKVAKGQYTFLSPWWDDISDSAKDLVSHLLTVDPEKRYTIDDFLQHPWITNTDAKSALPRSSEVRAHLMTTPGGNRDLNMVRDASLSGALKDAFDVSNAVYRMEQELAHPRHMPSAIIEEEEEDDDAGLAEVAHIEHVTQNMSKIHMGGEIAASPQPKRNQAEPQFFDLHLEGATLLERRRQAKSATPLVV